MFFYLSNKLSPIPNSIIKAIWSFFLSALMALTFFSCNQDSASVDEGHPKEIPFSGYWVNEKYYNDLMRTRSPKMAQDESTCLFVPDSTNKATQFIYNFHEGAGPVQIKYSSNQYALWTFSSDSSEQFLDSIILLSKDRIRIGKNYFRQVEAYLKRDNYYIPEAMLVEGNYLLQDGSQIHFSKDRRIKGWAAHSYYEVQSDYYDAGLQVDQIALGLNDSIKNWYGFRFSKDSLLIYELNCLTKDKDNDFCLEVEFGKLKYALRQIK